MVSQRIFCIFALLFSVSVAAAAGSPPAYNSRDIGDFSQYMSVSRTEAPGFVRFHGGMLNLVKGDMSMEVAFTKYTCRGGVEVTLLGTAHVADRAFFEKVDREALKSDQILFEGVRPSGFFGPPMERDDSLVTREDHVHRNKLRLLTISGLIVSFRQAKKRPPTSMDDLLSNINNFGPFQRFLAYDSWGNQMGWTNLSDGTVQLESANPDQTKIVLLAKIPRLNDRAQAINERQVDAAEAAGLIHENDYNWQSEKTPKSFEADVSSDMLSNNLDSSIQEDNFALRNVYPMMKLDDLIESANPPHSIAISYGVDHMPTFHQFLTGDRLGCKMVSQEWQTTFKYEKDKSWSQLLQRRDLINSAQDDMAGLSDSDSY